MTAPRRTDCEGFYRRDFLKVGSAGLLGLGLADLLRLEARAAKADKTDSASAKKAKSVIMIWLAGGGGKGGGMNLRVRGIQLPGNFTLDDLAKRDDLLRQFDQGFKKLDQAGDLVDGLDEFHRQALDILRSDKTKKAFDLGKESS